MEPPPSTNSNVDKNKTENLDFTKISFISGGSAKKYFLLFILWKLDTHWVSCSVILVLLLSIMIFVLD